MRSGKLIGLIGNPLSQSFSNGYFTEKFNREGLTNFKHQNFEIQDVKQVLTLLTEHPGMLGFNVTYPFKKMIIPLLSQLDPVALAAGAVNTVKVSWRENRPLMVGYNTDVTGFRMSLDNWIPGSVSQALVLGSGGAAGAVRAVLNEKGMSIIQLSRNPSGACIGYKEAGAAVAQKSLLWVNCTPLGMRPYENMKPELDYQSLTMHHHLYDLVYNPPLTRFMEEGLQRGAQVKNGYEMLVLQAESSWDIWTRHDEDLNS